jgi:hypothetical protein
MKERGFRGGVPEEVALLMPSAVGNQEIYLRNILADTTTRYYRIP